MVALQSRYPRPNMIGVNMKPEVVAAAAAAIVDENGGGVHQHGHDSSQLPHSMWQYSNAVGSGLLMTRAVDTVVVAL